MGKRLIDGVVVTPQRKIANPKGDVLHALKRSAPEFAGFAEAYFSSVHPGAIKGWKRHRRVTLNILVPIGCVQFVIHDDRSESPTQGAFFDVLLSPDHYARLTVAPGLWMAFRGVGPGMNLLLNIIDEEHDPAESDDAELSAFPFGW